MASKKTVTSDNLATLGAERLAAILVDLANADAEVKRRLRLELAAQVGGDTIAAEIGKRITTLRTARSFIDWQKQRDFVKDLDLQRTMIVERVAMTRPDLALGACKPVEVCCWLGKFWAHGERVSWWRSWCGG